MVERPEFKDERLSKTKVRELVEAMDEWRQVGYYPWEAPEKLENLLEEMKGWRYALAAHYMAYFYDGAPDADDSPIPQR